MSLLSTQLVRVLTIFNRARGMIAFVALVMVLVAYSMFRSDDVRRARITTAALVTDASPNLGVAWLMSFPNSGTTYTSAMVQIGSGLTTATNYGHEFSDGESRPTKVTQSQPVFNHDGHRGPFRFSNYPLPERFILTKTHCGGFGFSDCRPRDYALTPLDFLHDCVRGAHFTPDPQARQKIHVTMAPAIREWVQYEPALVKKAVHLVRNPLDNVVARFHHEYKLHALGETVDLPDWHGSSYQNDREGFRAWCRDTDSRFREEREQYLKDAALKHLDKVPCHAELYKYTQWHNLAFAVTAYLGIPPPFVLHYEDFHNDFQMTKFSLFNYLDLKQVASVPPFSYRGYEAEYYSPEEREQIYHYVKDLSSMETWSNIKQYFAHINVK